MHHIAAQRHLVVLTRVATKRAVHFSRIDFQLICPAFLGPTKSSTQLGFKLIFGRHLEPRWSWSEPKARIIQKPLNDPILRGQEAHYLILSG